MKLLSSLFYVAHVMTLTMLHEVVVLSPPDPTPLTPTLSHG